MKRAKMQSGEPIPAAVMQADLPIRSGVAIPGGFTRGESIHFSLTWLGADLDAVEWDWPPWGRRILVSRGPSTPPKGYTTPRGQTIRPWHRFTAEEPTSEVFDA